MKMERVLIVMVMSVLCTQIVYGEDNVVDPDGEYDGGTTCDAGKSIYSFIQSNYLFFYLLFPQTQLS
jgi:hypothetical protein